jgi:predicted DCC family thiol-disulfide oxidoreductase YuxK
LRLPEFIIGGAPRSGTTWLYELLDRHPDVHMAKPLAPEPKFFLRDDEYAKGLEYYSQKWFADADAAKVAGEKSTDYLESADAAVRIARALPHVKLIFILREPVSRAYSNYLWSRMNGLETEGFATALKLEEQRERELPDRLKFTRPFSYFSRGLYAELLEPYFNRFVEHQLLVARFEDIIERPSALAETVHRFLGLAARPGDAERIGVINPSTPDTEGLAADVRRELAARYVEPNRRLAAMLGPSFPMWNCE